METTFPPALVDKINAMNEPDIQAELATVGEVRMAEPSPYHVIVDRISHDIPFYRGYLKNAALSGTIVINNPFWWTAFRTTFPSIAATSKMRRSPARSLSIIHSGGAPTTSFSTLRWAPSWALRFRRLCCRSEEHTSEL